MIRNQMLSSREDKRIDLLERKNHKCPEQKLTFNISCYPALQNVKSTMEELHVLLTPNKEHKKA